MIVPSRYGQKCILRPGIVSRTVNLVNNVWPIKVSGKPSVRCNSLLLLLRESPLRPDFRPYLVRFCTYTEKVTFSLFCRRIPLKIHCGLPTFSFSSYPNTSLTLLSRSWWKNLSKLSNFHCLVSHRDDLLFEHRDIFIYVTFIVTDTLPNVGYFLYSLCGVWSLIFFSFTLYEEKVYMSSLCQIDTFI